MNAVIDCVLAALNAGDLEALVACYDPMATIEDGNDGVLARGHLEIRKRYGPMCELYPELRVEPLGRWEVGSFVVQEERVTGRARSRNSTLLFINWITNLSCEKDFCAEFSFNPLGQPHQSLMQPHTASDSRFC